jgi:glucokinase
MQNFLPNRVIADGAEAKKRPLAGVNGRRSLQVNFPYPVLVCDIGGTNVRFAAAVEPGAALGPIVVSKTADHENFEESVAAVLHEFSPRPRSFIVCAAGPLDGRKLKMTNAAWTIDGAALVERFGFAQGLLLNDFEAQALSLPSLPPEDWAPIGSFALQRGTAVVLGSGTGLGVAALADSSGQFLALSSEAGHVDFGPASKDEEVLWPHIETGPIGRVSPERLLSGPGLVRLHQARLRAAGLTPQAVIEGSAITERALADPASEEAHSIRLFLRLLARFSGDLALTFMARGGVALSGGILPKLVDLLDAAAFRTAFEAKAPHQALLRQIGTRLILTEAAVLLGMAKVAQRPDLYAIDFENRAWCCV